MSARDARQHQPMPQTLSPVADDPKRPSAHVAKESV